jgi:hypothetical protein
MGYYNEYHVGNPGCHKQVPFGDGFNSIKNGDGTEMVRVPHHHY